MNFADALDAALDRGTYESPRAPRSAATFTSRHANPFLYSALGDPFAERRVFSAQRPFSSESPSSRDCTTHTTTAFTCTRAARQPDSTLRDGQRETTCAGIAANDDANECFTADERTGAPQVDDATRACEAETAGARATTDAFDESHCWTPLDSQCGHESASEKSDQPRSRMLTVAERHALDTLVKHGARLTPVFSLAELRHEYRRLARRLHPDTHPDSTAAELAQLSARFAAVSSSYQVLASVR